MFLPVISDGTHFMSYMKDASIAYDYIGERLICYNDSLPYAYVYMFRTQSWHKMGINVGSAIQEIHFLNSYPDAYVSVLFAAPGPARILNLSTVLDVTSNLVINGIIITRPFDLGEPDVRKAIKQVRIRGQFNRNDVQYILMGSFDGIHWQRLRSLRGGSYKLFRMIICAKLAPTERISWIDIDYE